MANDLKQSMYDENEINLKEIFKVLIESKKLIILTIIVFTTVSIIYSLVAKPSFISSTKLEIGYFEMADGTQQLIETPSDLISNLKILIFKNPDNKFTQDISMNSKEGKLIQFKTTSRSIEQNENLLTEILNYIDERHSKLALSITKHKQDEISHKIELIESELSFLKEAQQIELEAKQIELDAQQIELEVAILKIQNDLPILDQEISQLGQVIIDDSNNLKLLQGTTYSLETAAISPTLEQIISSYKSKINQLRRERNNSNSDLDYLSFKLNNLKNQKLKNLRINTLQSDEIFNLVQQKILFENELQTLNAQTLLKTNPIGGIQSNTIKKKISLMIILGLIIGTISGIFLGLIRNFAKSYKESEA